MLEFEEKIPDTVKLPQVRQAIAAKMTEFRTSNQIEFILALLEGHSQTEAARRAYPNMNKSTVNTHAHELMRRDDIKEIVSLMKADVIPTKITLYSDLAVETLRDLMENGKSEKAKLGAATKMLEQAVGTPMQRKHVVVTSWHGNIPKSELLAAMRKNIERNEEVIDVEAE
jgi:DNA polymerase/3'-5' exonuclease PolX